MQDQCSRAQEYHFVEGKEKLMQIDVYVYYSLPTSTTRQPNKDEERVPDSYW